MSVEEFDDILRFWFDRGVRGLRIDVAHGLSRIASSATATQYMRNRPRCTTSTRAGRKSPPSTTRSRS